jgi:phosphate transport system permease protein
MATTDPTWHGSTAQISRIRGVLFKWSCLTSTAIGLVAVFVLLLNVAFQAVDPLSADRGWYGVYFVTLVVPLGALAIHYYRSESPDGEVAFIATGLPVVGLLVAGGLFILYAEVLPVKEWFALAISIAAAGAVVWSHGRFRPDATRERIALVGLAPVVLVLGTPPNSVALALGIPKRIVSLREVILGLPYLPLPSLQLVATLTLPIVLLAGWVVARRRERLEDGITAAALLTLGAPLGIVLGSVGGLAGTTAVVLYTTVVVPLAIYDDRTLQAVFPCTTGEHTYTVGDALDAFERGDEDWLAQFDTVTVDRTEPWLDAGVEVEP